MKSSVTLNKLQGKLKKRGKGKLDLNIKKILPRTPEKLRFSPKLSEHYNQTPSNSQFIISDHIFSTFLCVFLQCLKAHFSSRLF